MGVHKINEYPQAQGKVLARWPEQPETSGMHRVVGQYWQIGRAHV